jgi:hypothetical protein
MIAIQIKLSEQLPGTCSQHANAERFTAALEHICQEEGIGRGRLSGCKDKFILLAGPFEEYFDFLSLGLVVNPEWQGRLWQLVETMFKVSVCPQTVAQF